MAKCEVRCCICLAAFNFMTRYGRDGACCSKECWRELEWRRTLAVMGTPYRPQEAAKGVRP